MPGKGEGDGLPAPDAGRDNPDRRPGHVRERLRHRRFLPQTNCSQRLGLDAYTIRKLRDEAKGEAEWSSGGI